MVASLAAGSRSAWQFVGTSAFAPGSRQVIHPYTHSTTAQLALGERGALPCTHERSLLHLRTFRSTQIPKSGKLDAKVMQ